MCGLMVVGGSPGGTAGGMRTTTCAIAGAEILRILRGRTTWNSSTAALTSAPWRGA